MKHILLSGKQLCFLTKVAMTTFHPSCGSLARHQTRVSPQTCVCSQLSHSSTASCKQPQRTIKHSIRPMDPWPHNGPSTINRLYFIGLYPVKVSGEDGAIHQGHCLTLSAIHLGCRDCCSLSSSLSFLLPAWVVCLTTLTSLTSRRALFLGQQGSKIWSLTTQGRSDAGQKHQMPKQV